MNTKHIPTNLQDGLETIPSTDLERAKLFITSNIPVINGIERVSGGIVHYVFRIVGSNGTFYLKVRDTSFAEVPRIASNPKDIRYEYRAL